MLYDPHDTIAALSSPPGPAVRGIIRASGADCRAALQRVFEPDDAEAWNNAIQPARHAGRIHLTAIERRLPVAVYFWPTGRSYTGEPMAEIHLCGSPPLLEAILAELYAAGVRPARAGEFTLRSFLTGKIDLLQAEAVLGVIDADDQVQLKSALEQLAGGISGAIHTVRDDLLALLADLEAGLDFVEEDIEFVASEEIQRRVADARQVVAELLKQAVDRMRYTGTARVVLAGPPNAGKSTLFNALLGRSAALVSEVAGTTRDYLVADVQWHGRRIELLDTAGWERETTGPLQSALALRDDQLRRANLILCCLPAGTSAAEQFDEYVFPPGVPRLNVVTKCDLADADAPAGLPVSGATGAGLAELTSAVVDALGQSAFSGGELLGTTGARCRDSLQGAVAALDRAAEIAELGLGDELLSIEIRTALDELGKVSGAVYTDDILDRIFSKFCIGK